MTNFVLENDGLQKKSYHPLSGRKMRQFKQSKDCVAALSMMDSIVFGSLLQQVWPTPVVCRSESENEGC